MSLPDIIAFVLILVGAIQCFFGYQLFRVLTAVVGFAVGAAIGGVLGYIAMREAGAMMIGLLIGLLGGWLAFKLYKLGVFVICFGAGAVVGAALGLMAGGMNTVIPFAAVVGIALGVLGVILTKPVIIISTAVGGGMSIGIALGSMMGNLAMGVILGIVISIAGILVQFHQDKKVPQTAEEPEQSVPAPAEARKIVHLPAGVGDAVSGAGTAAGAGLKSAFASLRTGAAAVGQKMGSGAQTVASSQAVQRLRGIISNTRTTHPLPGWNELVVEKTPLWMAGLPVAVTEARIVAPTDGEGGTYLALGMQNLSDQPLLGVFFAVKCADLLKQELTGIEKLTVQDIRLEPGELWFSSKPFPLPDGDTRRIELTVKNVVLADGTIWSNETGEALTALADQPALDLPSELGSELFRESRSYVPAHDPEKIFRYQPQAEEDYWLCACGQLNTGASCLACGMERSALFDLARPERLAEIRQARLAEQKRLEEERRQKIAAQTQAAREKAAEVGAKTAETVKKGTDKAAQWGKQTGGVLAQRSKAAGEKLQTLWKEKVVANKREIGIVVCVFIAAMAVCLGVIFGLRAYRSSQAGQDRLPPRQTAEDREQAPTEQKTAQELSAWEAQFFFPYSDKEPLAQTDLEDTGEADLILAKNEILARHGRIFDTPALAEHFEAQEWYEGTTRGDEFDESALSDVEKANFDLIDGELARRQAAQTKTQVAQVLLAKLDEHSAFDPAPEGAPGMEVEGLSGPALYAPVPMDGIYYWTGIAYDNNTQENRVALYWKTGAGHSCALRAPSETILLSAKVLDMDHNGVPELLLFYLAGGHPENVTGQALLAELWESDGAGGVAMTRSLDLTPLPPMDMPSGASLALVPGAEREYLHIQDGIWDAFYTAGQSEAAARFYGFDGSGGVGEPDTDPDWQVDGAQVSEADYRQALAQWSQGEQLLGDSISVNLPAEFNDSDRIPFPMALCGTLRLDLKAELDAAREALTGLANQ